MKKNKMSLVLGLILFVGLTALFTENFKSNLFHIGMPYDPNTWRADVFEVFQMDSQLSISLMLEKTKASGLWSTGGFMLLREINGPVYTSAFGLHGKLFSVLYRLCNTDLQTFIDRSQYVICFLTAVSLALLVLFAYKEFGMMSAITLVALSLVSDWFVFCGRNLYYLYFSMFLPLVVSFWLFPKVLNGTTKFRNYVLLVTIPVLFKALCFVGFETNVILTTGIAPIYYGILFKARPKQIARWVGWLFFAGCLATVIAIAATIIQAGLWLNSFSEGFNQIWSAYSSRMGGQADPGRSAPVGVSIFQIFDVYLTLPAITIPIHPWRFRVYATFFAFFMLLLPATLVSLLDGRFFQTIEHERRKIIALSVATIWAFGASLSWAFLMKGHMSHHFHMNGMIFYTPFMLMLYMLLGKDIGLVFSTIVSAFRSGLKQSTPSSDKPSLTTLSKPKAKRQK